MEVLALWSQVLEPGKTFLLDVETDVQITNVAFDEDIKGNGRSVVKIRYLDAAAEDDDDDEDEEEDEEEETRAGEDKTTIVAALTPGKIEQATVNIILPGSETGYVLSVAGSNKVHLLGHYIRQPELDQDPYGGEFDSEDDSEMGEYDPDLGLEGYDEDEDEDFDEEDDDDDEDAGPRIQEITSEAEAGPSKAKSLKRALPADAEGDESMADADTSKVSIDSSKLSKNQRKKLAKKMKGENGEAVPTLIPEVNVTETKEVKTTADGKKETTTTTEVKEVKEGKKKDQAKGAADKKGDAQPKEKKVTLPSGTIIEDHTVGSGPVAKPGSRVEMRYIGKLTNGKVFDKNTKGAPFSFILGRKEVIAGWDEGIKGMKVGGERKLTIPPKQAYGKQKTGGIPANSTLVFEVKLLNVK